MSSSGGGWAARIFRRRDGVPLGRSLLPAGCLSLAISFLAMLYGPLELFFTNKYEFRFDFWLLAPQLLAGFGLLLAALAVGFALCYGIHVRVYDAALLVGAVGFVCSYVQGMFLAGHLPPLDGRAMQWQEYAGQNVYTYILWAAAAAAAGVLTWRLGMRRMYGVISGLSLFLTAVLLVTGITVGAMNGGFRRMEPAAVTKDQEFTMSTEENFVIFVVDAADSRTFSQLLASQDPEFADILADFTYYPDTLGAYTFTEHSIPFILEGQWYENQGDFRGFVTKAMDTSPLLTRLEREGYRMGLYEEDLIYDSPRRFQFENILPVKSHFSSTRALLKEEMKLVWFKYAPFPLKRLTFPSIDRINGLLALSDGKEYFRAANWDFDRDVKQAPGATTPDKCFRFIHVEGAHVPFRYDRQLRLIPSSQGSYPMNLEASMTLVGRYLQRLKDMGVYDHTAIVILGDHGYGYERADTTLGRNNPLLAIKGWGERHRTMQTSARPVSYGDLQGAYGRLLDGAAGGAAFDGAQQNRVRRFLMYEYTQEDHMVEYVLKGHAFDIENMVPTGRVFDADAAPRS